MLKQELNKYYVSLELQGKSQKTIKTYSSVLDNFVNEYSEFTFKTVQDFYYGYSSGKSLSTRNLIFSTLNSFGQWLRRQRYIKENPCELMDRPKTPSYTPRPIPGDDFKEINLKIDSMCLKYRVAFGLLRTFGLRAGELVSLNVESIDLNPADPTLWIRRKGGKVSGLPMDCKSDIYRLLTDYLSLNKRPKGPLFLSSRGTRESYDNIRRQWIENVAGEEYVLHQLRHTKATRMINDGASIRDTQLLLGHASPSTTIRYTLGGEEAKERLRAHVS